MPYVEIVRCATDPDLRFSPSGQAIGSFRAVWSKSKKNDKDEWETVREMWMTVTAFGPLGEFAAEHISKGQQVSLNGEIYEEEWETNEGEKRKTIKVIANGLNPLPKRDRQSSGGGQQRPQQASSQPSESPWGPPPGQADEPPF